MNYSRQNRQSRTRAHSKNRISRLFHEVVVHPQVRNVVREVFKYLAIVIIVGGSVMFPPDSVPGRILTALRPYTMKASSAESSILTSTAFASAPVLTFAVTPPTSTPTPQEQPTPA